MHNLTQLLTYGSDSTCRHGDLRLYGGYVSFEGVPEICINGKWAYTCQSSWDLDDSTVFCRHLLNVQNVSKFITYFISIVQLFLKYFDHSFFVDVECI